MKNLLLSVLLIFLPSVCVAQESPKLAKSEIKAPEAVNPKTPKPNKSETAKPLQRPVEIFRTEEHQVLMVDKHTKPHSKYWAFVVDSSHSTWDIAGRVIVGFQAAVGAPSDQLKFCAYVFNNSGCHKFRPWEWASVDAFEATKAWIQKNKGVSSYAEVAIWDALLGRSRCRLTITIHRSLR